MTPRPSTALQKMFGRDGAAEFHRRCWPERADWQLGSGSKERLRGLADEELMPSLEEIARRQVGAIRAQAVVGGELRTRLVPAAEAETHHRQGHLLVFEHMDLSVPTIGVWLAALAEELGLRRLDLVAHLFVSAVGGRTPKHFDSKDVFVVPIHGTKRWQLARNRDVQHPTCNGAPLLEPSPELRLYCSCDFSREMPADSAVVELSPGNVLFVPRGWWHATESEGSSWSLSIGVTQPSWADLLLGAVRSRLLESERWREPAPCPASGGGWDPAARRRARELLTGWLAGVQDLAPEELLRS